MDFKLGSEWLTKVYVSVAEKNWQIRFDVKLEQYLGRQAGEVKTLTRGFHMAKIVSGVGNASLFFLL